MDDLSPIARLTRAGAVDVALSATIRPTPPAIDETGIATDDTLYADADADAEAEPRPLPRITVDLRGTLSPDEPPTPGADLEVRRLLAEGGMGRVFVARQHSLARDVAVKTTKDGAPRSAVHALLFEGAICGQLEHPSIVPVHAMGLDQFERPALVMKRIEGETWDRLRRDPSHPLWAEWSGNDADRLLGHLEILMQVCNAVHFGHTRGIVHRDLKPENVLIGAFGDVYVADWGIATRLDGPAEARLCGTPGYMAPEMVRGEAVDERTDVYLLGAVLHEILTGELRHDAASAAEALASSLASTPATYDEAVPAELGELANRACHPDPRQRPATAKAFREAIAGFLRHRASIQLAARATERLDRLQALHEELRERRLRHPDEAELEDDGESRRELDRLIAEARFGLEQALEEWPHNGKAAQARRRLERILDERRAHTASLERLARDRDPRVGQRQRTLGLSIIAVLGLVISADVTRRDAVVTPRLMFAYAAVIFTVVAVLTFVLRRRILRNAFGRQLAATVVVGCLLMVIPRFVGLFVPVDVPGAFARDMFALTGVCAVAALTLIREAVVMAVVSLAAAVGIMVWPEHAAPLFGFATSLQFVVAAIASHRTTLDSSRAWFS